ncbi:MAG: DNA/RNA non-specific endonuclease [Lachnospiraceae bacterium]|nr:DNA/RNA non-specific endonuclease [Lachnospiraceae bacterium]
MSVTSPSKRGNRAPYLKSFSITKGKIAGNHIVKARMGSTKEEVIYGQHYMRNSRRQKILKPNIRYTDKNGYTYETDGNGRIIKASAKKLVLGDGKRNKHAQRTVGKGRGRRSTDDGGHIFGSRFNGSGDIDNLLPQDSGVNRSGGEWYLMEEEWANALHDNSEVRVLVYPRYRGNSHRPSCYIVIYWIDGRLHRKIISNR